MILSHRHRFLFIHCRKAAGSSVAVSLARYLGPADLQLSAIRDAASFGIAAPLRTQLAAVQPPRPRAFVRVLRGQQPWSDHVARAIKARHRQHLGAHPDHAPAAAVRAAFPRAWQHYWKFCIVRNPWDKTLSDYRWRTRERADPPSFATYVEALHAGDDLGGIVPTHHDNWDLYTIDDRIAVDHVVRFEDLADGLAAACREAGLAWDGWLPHSKRSRTEAHGHYRDGYTERHARMIGDLYAREIDAFGYRF